MGRSKTIGAGAALAACAVIPAAASAQHRPYDYAPVRPVSTPLSYVSPNPRNATPPRSPLPPVYAVRAGAAAHPSQGAQTAPRSSAGSAAPARK